jgi:hypothetical protein
MNRLFLVAMMTLGAAGLAAAPASARNYDCAKAGNATKTECKAAAKAAPKVAAKPMVAAKAAAKPAAPAKVATKTVTKTERNYDCRLAGNKNKTACHTAATPAKPVVKQVTTATTTRNYDCAKAGNSNKTVCKAAAVAKTVAVAKPVAKPAPKPAASSDDKNPAGAIGRCKDGFYSHSKQREGACSRHGGVAKWA